MKLKQASQKQINTLSSAQSQDQISLCLKSSES
jgi:hypothetical protein